MKYFIGEDVVANNEVGYVVSEESSEITVHLRMRGYSRVFASHNVMSLADAYVKRAALVSASKNLGG